MDLKIAEESIQVQVTQTEQVTSPHSGRPLDQRTIRFQARGPQRDLVERLLSVATREGATSEDEGGGLRKWRVQQKSMSFTDRGPGTIYSYLWQLDEAEVIAVEQLVVDGTSYRPYEYSEKVDGGKLTINARLRLGQDGWVELRNRIIEGWEGPRYFPVVRQGLNDSPVEMRYGNPTWSRHDDQVKVELVLIDRKTDETARRDGNAWSMLDQRPLKRVAANTAGAVEALLGTLVERGVLSADDRTAIEQAARTKAGVWGFEFRRVDDVDDDDI